jgi:hypothetical protein
MHTEGTHGFLRSSHSTITAQNKVEDLQRKSQWRFCKITSAKHLLGESFQEPRLKMGLRMQIGIARAGWLMPLLGWGTLGI